MNSIFVIEGNYVESKGILDRIKNSLTDYESFSFDENDSYDYVSQMMKEISCFGMKRLFILHSLPKIIHDSKTEKSVEENLTEENTKDDIEDGSDEKEEKESKSSKDRTKILNGFKKLFPTLPKNNIVVFYNVGISAESFFNEVKKCGKVFLFKKKIDKDKAKQIVYEYFKKKGITVFDNVSSFIIDSLGVEGSEISVDVLNILLRKIYHYVYGKSTITETDINSLCATLKEFVIWSFYKQVDSKDFCSSLKTLYNYLSNVKYFQVEASLLLYNMVWRYGLLLAVKSGKDIKKSRNDIQRTMESIKKLGMTGKSYRIKMNVKEKEKKPVSEYSSKMIEFMLDGGCDRYTLLELSFIYSILVKTVIKIRSGCTDSEVMMILNILCMVLCGCSVNNDDINLIFENKKMVLGVDCGTNI